MESTSSTAPAERITDIEVVENYVGGRWRRATTEQHADVFNPATGRVIARTPLSTRADLDAAVQAAKNAFPGWRDTPVVLRARALFRFVELLEAHAEDIARTVTTEHGKTLAESRGSVRRGIECVEVACGAPSLMMGYGLENIASNVDSVALRQPIGVVAAIAPFNFPAMVPLWFLPFAVASGNTIVREAVRAGAVIAAVDVQAARAMRPAARRGEPRQRRARGGRRHLRSSRHSRGVLRRIDARRQGGLSARDACRQTGAGARRRQEFRDRDARRRFRPRDREHHGVVLRVRGRALPGGQRAGPGGRRASRGARSARRIRAQPQGR